jgi:hypothetical protein
VLTAVTCSFLERIRPLYGYAIVSPRPGHSLANALRPGPDFISCAIGTENAVPMPRSKCMNLASRVYRHFGINAQHREAVIER